jgi:hypothetical protein
MPVVALHRIRNQVSRIVCKSGNNSTGFDRLVIFIYTMGAPGTGTGTGGRYKAAQTSKSHSHPIPRP